MKKLCKKYANNGNSFCSHQFRARYVVEQETWETDGYSKFIRDARWCYDFECEDKVKSSDFEQSFLSQMIFGHLLTREVYSSFKVNRNKITVLHNENKIFFSLDVMNNWKDDHQLGKVAKTECEKELLEWKTIYHTIGNFTVIPNLIINGRHHQLRHNDLNERWDLLLNYCRSNWSDYTCSQQISFSRYMKISLQQIYYQDIYNDLLSKIKGRQLNEIEDKEYLSWVDVWNDKIEAYGDSMSLLIFDEKKIKETVGMIRFLIEVRGRLIYAYLRSNK